MRLAAPCEISLLSHSLLICQILPKTRRCVEIHRQSLKMLSQLVSKQIITARSDIKKHPSWVDRGSTSCTQLTSLQSNAPLRLLCCGRVKSAKPNRKIHKSTENKCINERKGYNSNTPETGGFPHSMKFEHRGETEMTTNCAELRVPFSPALWNYIPVNQHQQCQNPKQKHIPRASFHRMIWRGAG